MTQAKKPDASGGQVSHAPERGYRRIGFETRMLEQRREPFWQGVNPSLPGIYRSCEPRPFPSRSR